MSRLVLGSVIALTLSACATSSSFKKPPLDQNYGEAPNYSEDSMKPEMKANLKDPDSAKYRFSPAVKAYCNNGILSGGDVVWTGWVVPVEQNAKNSYGAYVGYKKYYARFNGDSVMEVSAATNRNTLVWDFTPKLGTGCLLLEK